MASLNTDVRPLLPSGAAPCILPQYTQYADAAPSFKTFAPRDPVAQAKYDAMSETWQGVDSSNAAIARGDYQLDSSPTTTYTAPSVATPPAKEAEWFCVVQ